MRLVVDSKYSLDGEPHREVILVGPADATQKLEDPRSDMDDMFSPFWPPLDELVTVRHVLTGLEENVEPHRLKQLVAIHGECGRRVALQAADVRSLGGLD